MPKNKYNLIDKSSFAYKKHYTFEEAIKEQSEGTVLEWKVSRLMSPEQIQQAKNDLNTKRGKQPYWL